MNSRLCALCAAGGEAFWLDNGTDPAGPRLLIGVGASISSFIPSVPCRAVLAERALREARNVG